MSFVKNMKKFPKLIVFDCDMCLWSPEMYTLNSLPNEKVIGELQPEVSGVIGAQNESGDVVRLFDGALKALQDYALGKFGTETRIAAASSADTPYAVKCAHKAMETLEVLPGQTMKQVFNKGFSDNFTGNLQIGRTGKLSSNKTTHFSELLKETGIPYNEMLFFDDCNWSDCCGTVTKGCPGVIAVRTPEGLTTELFEKGLTLFNEK